MSDSPHPSGGRLRDCVAFHEIPFTPVPVKLRHDGWTPARQRGFIDRLGLCGCVARAARAVGKTPQSAYRLRDHRGAASFRRAWDAALAAGQSYMIDVGLERGLVGQCFPIVRRGRVVGERVRYDNRLAMAALNAMERRASRSAVRDPAALLERYLDLLERRSREPSAEK
jgi:hypothetical protein